MMAWYTIILGICLGGIIHVNSQITPENTYAVKGKTYQVYKETTLPTWNDASGFCRGVTVNGDLAVFEDKESYTELVEKMEVHYTNGDKFHIGVVKEAGEIMLKTVGGRVVPFSNHYDEEDTSGANPRRCIYMQLSNSGSPDYHSAYANSYWQSTDCGTNDPDYFICQTDEDTDCSLTGDLCSSGSRYSRDIDDYCFWSPFPRGLMSRANAQNFCKDGGGEIFNVYHDNELDYLHSEGYFDAAAEQSLNRFWTGFMQGPGKGAPRSPNGYIPDSSTDYLWGDKAYYGSSLSSVGYSILYRPNDRTWDLYNVAPYDQDFQRVAKMAFTLCEAEEDDFCHANSPEVGYADKKIDDDKVYYTCKTGYEFPDGTTVKYFDCSCKMSDLAAIPVPHKCVLRNPCLDEDSPCEHHCHFTDQSRQSYYCTCDAGYRLRSDGSCDRFLSPVEIGLIVGLSILSLLVICMFIWLCCLQLCLQPRGRVRQEHGGNVEYITAKPQDAYNPYGYARQGGPRFRLY